MANFFKSKGTKANRTAGGSPSATVRRKKGYKGTGRFPIFDTRSAKSALKLRGKAHSPAERAWIIRTAAKYAPAMAAKARKVDK